jgi:hypothetical protein
MNISRNAIYDRPAANGQKDTFLSKETGRVAWLLWRSAYFTMTLSWRNKLGFWFQWYELHTQRFIPGS